MSGPIQITFNAPVDFVAHPCTYGTHRWAWLAVGGQECGYCGVRRG